MDFLKANAGKLGVAAAFLVAAVAIYLMFGGYSEGPSRSDKVRFVCVETGETFWIERAPHELPLENPETKRRTLIPCYEREDGTLAVSKRVSGILEDLKEQGLLKYVDQNTLSVKESD